MHHVKSLAMMSMALTAGLLAAGLVPVAKAGPDAPVPSFSHARAGSAEDDPPPTPTRLAVGGVCPELDRVPNADFNRVFFDPSKVGGYNELCNPNLPRSMWNTSRSWLSLVDPAKPYHPLFNGMIWKCGCR